MRGTYAPNAFIIGTMIGIIVAFKVNVVLGIIAGLAVSIIGYVLIKVFENMIGRVGDEIENAVRKKIDEKRRK